jgi:octaprenyl-diphosphate synthase
MPLLDIKTALSLTDIHQLVKSDFEQVDALMQTSLHSDVSLIQTISAYIIHSGGKRLRPLLTLLAAHAVALGCKNTDHITLAVIVEFLHTATLLHDDVVDASSLRRGRKTVNEVWGNAPSVLVGDFLYSRAFQLMTSLQNIKIYDLLANATNIIAQGEVLQLIHRNQINTSQTHYLEVIRYKTATLFSAAAECGVVVGGGVSNARAQAAFALYGMHLGTAFQMIDDWLDYSVSSQETGKNPGDDLAEGKVTLPIIYAIQTGTAQQRETVQKALQTGNTKYLAEVLDILREIDAEKYVMDLAQQEANLAKVALHDVIPESPYKKGLITLADLAVQRKN